MGQKKVAKQSTEEVLKRMELVKDNSIVLGGDTKTEVKFSGKSSTGGGSALYFVANGTTPVLEALKI